MEDSVVMPIVGSGSLPAEISVLDKAPRSAACIAAPELAVAVFSTAALYALFKIMNSTVASRLTLLIAKRLSDRLREVNQKIKRLGSSNRALQLELDAAHSVGGSLTK